MTGGAMKRFFAKYGFWWALGLAVALLIIASGNLVLAQRPRPRSISIPISLPQLAIVHRVNNGPTASGRLVELGTDGVTVQRQDADPVRVEMAEIDEEKGIVFDQTAPFYRCQDCRIVYRGGEGADSTGGPVQFSSQPLQHLRVTDVATGQAELEIENPGAFRGDIGKCKRTGGSTCVADWLRIDRQAQTMTIQATPFSSTEEDDLR